MQIIKSDASVKKLLRIQRNTDQHWVGDGFPVRTLFSYPALGPMISPFCCLIMQGLWNSHRLSNAMAWASILIGVSKQSPLCIAVRWNIAIARVGRQNWPGRCAMDDGSLRLGSRRVSWSGFCAAWWCA